MSNKEKAIQLIEAYYDRKQIQVYDPDCDIKDWTNIENSFIWTYLEMFCKNLDKYRIIEE